MTVILILLGCGTTKTQNSASSKTGAQSQASQSQTTSSQAQTKDPAQLTTISLRWVGVDADTCSPNDLTTDGKPDGHFHISIPLNQPSLIKAIWIRYSEFGKSYKWGWIYNKNLPIAGYKMAVFDDTGQSILPQGDNGYQADGVTDLDLFISELNFENDRDTLKFQKGQVFSIEVDYVNQSNEEKEFDSTVTIM